MINNKYLAEFIGTAILVLVITGSGIMGYDLSRGNLGIALLINSIATGIALFILITIFINISGAHFNPLVTMVSWAEGEINLQLVCIFEQRFHRTILLNQCLGSFFTYTWNSWNIIS